jgi:hypothetical protein
VLVGLQQRVQSREWEQTLAAVGALNHFNLESGLPDVVRNQACPQQT